MPDRRTHMWVGATVGAGTAAIAARHQQTSAIFLEAAGGAIAGLGASVAPDLIEPALDSWHRGLAHSYAAIAATTAGALVGVGRIQADCRARAERHRQFARAAVGLWSQLWHTIAAGFWQLLAGAVVGLAAGYVSHLVLDAGTPRGLPLLGVPRRW